MGLPARTVVGDGGYLHEFVHVLTHSPVSNSILDEMKRPVWFAQGSPGMLLMRSLGRTVGRSVASPANGACWTSTSTETGRGSGMRFREIRLGGLSRHDTRLTLSFRAPRLYCAAHHPHPSSAVLRNPARTGRGQAMRWPWPIASFHPPLPRTYTRDWLNQASRSSFGKRLRTRDVTIAVSP